MCLHFRKEVMNKVFLRGWTYTFVGNYSKTTGNLSGSTRASFSTHEGCYTEVQAYVPNGITYAYGKDEDNSVSCSGNAGKNNDKLRIYHSAYSRIGEVYR